MARDLTYLTKNKIALMSCILAPSNSAKNCIAGRATLTLPSLTISNTFFMSVDLREERTLSLIRNLARKLDCELGHSLFYK